MRKDFQAAGDCDSLREVLSLGLTLTETKASFGRLCFFLGPLKAILSEMEKPTHLAGPTNGLFKILLIIFLSTLEKLSSLFIANV